MNKYKTAFIFSLIFSFLVIATATYIVFTNTLTSGHCKDNQIIINEDFRIILNTLSATTRTIDEFDQELNKLNIGHRTNLENGTIQLQIVHLIFDENGNFKKIETY